MSLNLRSPRRVCLWVLEVSLCGEMFGFCVHNLEIISDDFLPVLTERVSSVQKSALYRVYIKQVHYELHFSLLNCITN